MNSILTVGVVGLWSFSCLLQAAATVIFPGARRRQHPGLHIWKCADLLPRSPLLLHEVTHRKRPGFWGLAAQPDWSFWIQRTQPHIEGCQNLSQTKELCCLKLQVPARITNFLFPFQMISEKKYISHQFQTKSPVERSEACEHSKIDRTSISTFSSLFFRCKCHGQQAVQQLPHICLSPQLASPNSPLLSCQTLWGFSFAFGCFLSFQPEQHRTHLQATAATWSFSHLSPPAWSRCKAWIR